jgi:hypothetical protein
MSTCLAALRFEKWANCAANRFEQSVNAALPVKCWEIIADNLSKAGWSLGWVSAIDVQGRTIWLVDAHGYGKRFIVHADEILTAFVELQRAIHEFAVSLTL